jgi:hypothetical protein
MIKYDVQFAAGKLLGFYEAGDKIMAWVNSVDTADMTVKDFRKALNIMIMDLRPEIKIGRIAAT